MQIVVLTAVGREAELLGKSGHKGAAAREWDAACCVEGGSYKVHVFGGVEEGIGILCNVSFRAGI